MASPSNEEMLPPPRKKTCVRSSEEPDVTIVVGGVEFQEYSQAIRCWSSYFDRALSSGMRESTSKRFEFPDRDPNEWELIVAIVKPMATEHVTQHNLPIVASWFGELGCVAGLEECDDNLCKRLKGYGYKKVTKRFYVDISKVIVTTENVMKHNEDIVLDVLELSVEHNLPRSLEMSFEIVKHMLEVAPTDLGLNWFRRLVNCTQGHPLLEDDLWRSAALEEGQKIYRGYTRLSDILFAKHKRRRTKKRPLTAKDYEPCATCKFDHLLFRSSGE